MCVFLLRMYFWVDRGAHSSLLFLRPGKDWQVAIRSWKASLQGAMTPRRPAEALMWAFVVSCGSLRPLIGTERLGESERRAELGGERGFP